MTQMLEQTQESPTTDDPGECAHIVDQRDPKNDVGSAIVFGHEVEALCGYRWVPYRQPEGRPVCGDCNAAYGQVKL